MLYSGFNSAEPAISLTDTNWARSPDCESDFGVWTLSMSEIK